MSGEILRPRLRDRFLEEYARLLRKSLDEFTEGSGLRHRTSIRPGKISQVVVVEAHDPIDPWSERFIPQDKDWIPSYATTIDIQPPFQVTVTRLSDRFEDMLKWSNVQAWDDSSYIISSVLMRRQAPCQSN